MKNLSLVLFLLVVTTWNAQASHTPDLSSVAKKTYPKKPPHGDDGSGGNGGRGGK
ncbi:MAG: hypothetical protein KC493_15940 [Bacteriovoracaceae bacterium]|nr:hypothetical protein [Bacteriovoracaceae bacterium]